jgi:predicted CXXCH cytochrome family protein
VRLKPLKFCQLIGLNFAVLLAVETLNLPGAEPPKPETNAYAAYAGSESCRDCHRDDYNLWAQSHHALAERLLQPATDRTAFDPPRDFKHGDETTTARIQNGQFQIVTLGPQSNRQPFRVERVIGHDPLLQYLTLLPGGRYQVHEASYDPKSNQWFYVYGDDFRFPGEFGHWTGRGMNWNSFCAECHNTRLHKNYDAATDSYHTTMAEMAVGCEACHGPLKAHNEWRNIHTNTTLIDPTVSKMPPARIVGLCGSCHSRNTDLTENFAPGDSFYDHYSLEILDYDKRWYPDGQIKDEDYEFEAFMGSKMYQDGVICLDCHNPHSYKNTLQGNDLCMRCHNGGFLKAPKIDPASHKHECTSDCIGCHMPVTVYMQRHPRRDHGFTIPDPLLTKELNIQNACNRCHADKTTDWSLKYTERWYGTNMERTTRERARWIAAAENGEASAKDKLISLLADTNQAPYWRAVAATFLEQWANDPAAQTALLAQLKNWHPLVRERVVRSLEPALADTNVLAALQPLLNDPLRNVRVAAAWVLRATVDMQSQAGQDLQRMLDLEADQPTGQFEATMLLLARQQPAEALVHLKKATAWDKLSPPFLCTQAEVQDQLGQLSAALKTLDQAEAAVPDDPHIPYVRAVILKRNGRNDEAKIAANRALAIQPNFQPARELFQSLP